MATLKAASILIADDDGHRVALQELLTPRGYETVLASSGVEVLTIVRARVVDLLLLDVQMPGISGLETLRILREAEATLPCIFLTANPSREIVHQALSLRAFSVLSKPVTCGLVTMTIAHALERPVEHA
jgi:CheY-like chemotaxis protein